MIIIIKDGYDVIDNRPEAEIAQAERDYYEDQYNRDLTPRGCDYLVKI